MCGRFALTHPVEYYAAYFGVDSVKTESLQANYNVAPTDPVYAVIERAGERRLGTLRWGLISHWASDRRVASRHINARLETVATKPAFREALARRRCLIPADGFYEWERIADRGKLPHYIFDPDGSPLAFAGLWASWRDPESEEWVRTCTIVTGEPNPVVAPLHERMPVILQAEQWDAWLDPELRDSDELLALASTRSPVLAEHAVSTLVNSVENNLPELIEPLHS